MTTDPDTINLIFILAFITLILFVVQIIFSICIIISLNIQRRKRMKKKDKKSMQPYVTNYG